MNAQAKIDPVTQPSGFFAHPICYIGDYASVVRIVAKMPHIGEFIVIAESGVKVPTEVTKLKNVKVIRIRASGSWNSLFRQMADIEIAKAKGGYADTHDLMFLSFHSAHDISSAMKRHRAFAKLTCRELYYLSFIDNLDVPLDVIDHTLAMMPNVPSAIAYGDLSVEQRFILSEFEFSRFMRPVHCAESLDLLFKAIPFYERGNKLLAEMKLPASA